jgi:hypothetical protein
MSARHLWSLLAFASILACRPPAPAEPPELPATIELSTEFTGDPVRVTTLAGGIVVETLTEGEGETATEGKLVSFDYAAYRADTGELLPWHIERMKLGEETGNPLHAALQLVIAEQQPGARARVFVPATFVDASKPARAPAVGDVWFTVRLDRVREYPQTVGFDAFAGEPIATKIVDGIEIHDFATGEGPTAVAGDRIEVAVSASTMAGKGKQWQSLTNPEAFPYRTCVVGEESGGCGLPSKAIIEGARVGMLRKYVLPHGYTSASDPDKSPNEYEFAEYFQVISIGH